MPSDSAAIVERKPSARSQVSNGSAMFVEPIDGRTRASRRFRDVLAGIVSDLGGADGLSEGQNQLARRCSLIAVECERLEGRAVAGEPIDLELFGMLTDRLGRALQRLGLRRVARDVTSDNPDERLIRQLVSVFREEGTTP